MLLLFNYVEFFDEIEWRLSNMCKLMNASYVDDSC